MDTTNTPVSYSAGLKKAAPVVVGCVILIIAFFLPWIYFLGTPVSGFQLHELWSAGVWIWAAPILALVAIVAACLGHPIAKLGQVVGGIVFVFFIYAAVKVGMDIFGELAFGGWATLLSALFLVSFAPRLIKQSGEAADEGR